MSKLSRGNFDPTLIRAGLRQGDNNIVLMFGGGSAVAGNALIFDANGNAIDSGAVPGGTVTNSGTLTADRPVFGNGGTQVKVGTKSGNTDEVVTQSGAATANYPLIYDASGNAIAVQPRGNTTNVQMADSTTNPTTNDLAKFDANGNIKDSGILASSVLVNPMTTLGDVILGGASGAPARLAVGANGKILTANSGATDGVDWEAPLALTTTGTTGAATLTPGNPYTLNVPQYGSGGGGGGAMTQISRQVLAAAAATVTFTSIPGTFNHLLLLITCRSAANPGGSNPDTMNYQLNGDATAANYNSGYTIFGTTTTSGTLTGNQFLANCSSANLAANYPTKIQIWIPDYAETTFEKNLQTTVSYPGNSISANAASAQVITHMWLSTAAINSIVLSLASAGNFVAGSIFSLYGLT